MGKIRKKSSPINQIFSLVSPLNGPGSGANMSRTLTLFLLRRGMINDKVHGAYQVLFVFASFESIELVCTRQLLCVAVDPVHLVFEQGQSGRFVKFCHDLANVGA